MAASSPHHYDLGSGAEGDDAQDLEHDLWTMVDRVARFEALLLGNDERLHILSNTSRSPRSRSSISPAVSSVEIKEVFIYLDGEDDA